MRVTSFAEMEDEFMARVCRMVWCNVATVDGHGRPRSRVLHPIWEGSTGWIATRPQSPKAADLAANPYVSLAYIAEPIYPVYADCLAQWEDDPAVKQHVWDLCRTTPPPLGYDPASIFKAVDAPEYGVLRLTPYRIQLDDVSGAGERRIVWYADATRRCDAGSPALAR
ncbi:MAG: pyridoxamine 5'-phosphate oxidase family protein [Thermomicrobiales bacterium]